MDKRPWSTAHHKQSTLILQSTADTTKANRVLKVKLNYYLKKLGYNRKEYKIDIFCDGRKVK